MINISHQQLTFNPIQVASETTTDRTTVIIAITTLKYNPSRNQSCPDRTVPHHRTTKLTPSACQRLSKPFGVDRSHTERIRTLEIAIAIAEGETGRQSGTVN